MGEPLSLFCELLSKLAVTTTISITIIFLPSVDSVALRLAEDANCDGLDTALTQEVPSILAAGRI